MSLIFRYSGYALCSALALSLLIACGDSSGSDNVSQPPPPPPLPPVSNTVEFTQYVETHHVPLASLTDDEDFSDLYEWGVAIGSSRIIQLGESTHGSREMNQLKVRLIKYLHQHHGVDVVAFESSIFACNQGLEQTSASALQLMRSCVFGVWHTQEVLELFRYIRTTQSTDRPLRLSGFDMQISTVGQETASIYTGYFTDLLHRYGGATQLDIQDLMQRYTTSWLSVPDCYQQVASACATLRAGSDSLYNDLSLLVTLLDGNHDEQILAMLIAQSLAGSAQYFYALGNGDTRTLGLRDELMAVNLTGLAERVYPSSRIVVWAHNSHIAENYSLGGVQQEHDIPMGQYLHDHWGDDVFTVGFYMLDGSSNDNSGQSVRVTAHRPDSLEALAATVEESLLWLPFSKEDQPGADDDWLHQPTFTKYWGAWEEILILGKTYDGVVAIGHSTPSVYVQY